MIAPSTHGGGGNESNYRSRRGHGSARQFGDRLGSGSDAPDVRRAACATNLHLFRQRQEQQLLCDREFAAGVRRVRGVKRKSACGGNGVVSAEPTGVPPVKDT